MLNLPSTLEIVAYLSSVCQVCVFHKKKLTRQLRLRQKVGFLIKKLVFCLDSTGFAENLPIRWQLGDTLPPCPLAPLISRRDEES